MLPNSFLDTNLPIPKTCTWYINQYNYKPEFVLYTCECGAQSTQRGKLSQVLYQNMVLYSPRCGLEQEMGKLHYIGTITTAFSLLLNYEQYFQHYICIWLKFMSSFPQTSYKSILRRWFIMYVNPDALTIHKLYYVIMNVWFSKRLTQTIGLSVQS